jgi:hypothetical protein
MARGQDNTASYAIGLKAADTAARTAVRVAAGPFEASPPRGSAPRMTMPDALITGLLVIYPVLAIVAVVIIGLSSRVV